MSADPVRCRRHKAQARRTPGSQRQIPTYVNKRTSELCHTIARAPAKCLELSSAGLAHASEDCLGWKIDTTKGTRLPF